MDKTKSSTYEEFLKWKQSNAGKSLSNQKNTTIIKTNEYDQAAEEEANLMPQNPEEEQAIIEQMKYQPRGLGKGA